MHLPDDKLVERFWLDLNLLFEAHRHHGCFNLFHFRPLEPKYRGFQFFSLLLNGQTNATGDVIHYKLTKTDKIIATEVLRYISRTELVVV